MEALGEEAGWKREDEGGQANGGERGEIGGERGKIGGEGKSGK